MGINNCARANKPAHSLLFRSKIDSKLIQSNPKSVTTIGDAISPPQPPFFPWWSQDLCFYFLLWCHRFPNCFFYVPQSLVKNGRDAVYLSTPRLICSTHTVYMLLYTSLWLHSFICYLKLWIGATVRKKKSPKQTLAALLIYSFTSKSHNAPQSESLRWILT